MASVRAARMYDLRYDIAAFAVTLRRDARRRRTSLPVGDPQGSVQHHGRVVVTVYGGDDATARQRGDRGTGARPQGITAQTV